MVVFLVYHDQFGAEFGSKLRIPSIYIYIYQASLYYVFYLSIFGNSILIGIKKEGKKKEKEENIYIWRWWCDQRWHQGGK